MEFVPVRCEYLWYQRRMEYVGVSPMFRIVSDGQKCPEYNIEATIDEHANIKHVIAKEILSCKPIVREEDAEW